MQGYLMKLLLMQYRRSNYRKLKKEKSRMVIPAFSLLLRTFATKLILNLKVAISLSHH